VSKAIPANSASMGMIQSATTEIVSSYLSMHRDIQRSTVRVRYMENPALTLSKPNIAESLPDPSRDSVRSMGGFQGILSAGS
jgi:hypothetical protein